MIYTVFPCENDYLPQDFATKAEAVEFAEAELDCEYAIESTEGEVI